MHVTPFLLVAAPAIVLATLDPCTSNTKGACPSYLGCSSSKVSTAIQGDSLLKKKYEESAPTIDPVIRHRMGAGSS